MFKLKFLFPLIFILLVGNITANSRVAFSRPGKMMRIPSVDNSMYKNLLTLSLSSEVLSSSQSSSAFTVNTMSVSGYQYGISFVKPVNPTNSVELGFHLQKNLFEYGDVHFDVGIQDVLFLLENSGLKVHFFGKGTIKKQSLKSNYKIDEIHVTVVKINNFYNNFFIFI